MIVFTSVGDAPRSFAAPAVADLPRGWEVFHAIADLQLPRLRTALYDALSGYVNTVDLMELAEAIRTGRVDLAEHAIRIQGFEVALKDAIIEPLVTIIGQAGEEAAHQLRLPTGVLGGKFTGRFDLVDPHALDWIDQNVGTLIREITDEQRSFVIDMVHNAFQRGDIPPQRLAALIREQIGLTRTQAGYVQNYRNQLDNMVQDGSLRPSYVDTLGGRYQDNWLRYRSENIARTETINASIAGQQLAWQQGIADGQIDPTEVEQVWIVTNDHLTCEECRPLNGARAPLGGVFPGGYEGPTVHPRCRCAIGLVRKIQPLDKYVQDLPPYEPRTVGLHPHIPAAARPRAGRRGDEPMRFDFNPDEPRDDHGRWTTGGAGGGAEPIIYRRVTDA